MNKTRKIIMTVILMLAVMVTSCSSQSGDDLKPESVFSSSPTQTTKSDYPMSGTTYLSSERDLVDNLKSQNVFHSFLTKTTERDYQMSGTAYLSSERNLLEVEASADTEIFISGTLEREEGEIKLFIEDTKGNITTLIDSESNRQNTMKVDLSLPLHEGRWRFYFSGTSCIFNFNLNFGTQEVVDYFLNNM